LTNLCAQDLSGAHDGFVCSGFGNDNLCLIWQCASLFRSTVSNCGISECGARALCNAGTDDSRERNARGSRWLPQHAGLGLHWSLAGAGTVSALEALLAGIEQEAEIVSGRSQDKASRSASSERSALPATGDKTSDDSGASTNTSSS